MMQLNQHNEHYLYTRDNYKNSVSAWNITVLMQWKDGYMLFYNIYF